MGEVGPASAACLASHDADALGQSNQSLTIDDARRFEHCMSGPNAAVPSDCNPNQYPQPRSGDFGLHGQMIDVLADGKVLMHWRARTYDPEHGRFLQRDPSGYVDGPSLYEAFCGNPLMCWDPDGLDSTWLTGVLGLRDTWVGNYIDDSYDGAGFVGSGEGYEGGWWRNLKQGADATTDRVFGNPYAANARSQMEAQNIAGRYARVRAMQGQAVTAQGALSELASDLDLTNQFEAVQTNLAFQAATMPGAAIPVGSIGGALGRTAIGQSMNAFGRAAAAKVIPGAVSRAGASLSGRLAQSSTWRALNTPIGQLVRGRVAGGPGGAAAAGASQATAAVESAGTLDTIPVGRRMILRPIEIQFPAKGLSPSEQQLFAEHLAEQQATLNRLSLIAPNELQLNLVNVQNIESQVAASRSLARSYLPGSGAGMDAAHALDTVAGGYINEFVGFRNPIQQRVGALWRTRAPQIVPGREHRLVPNFGD